MKRKVQFFGILNITPDSFSDGGKYLTTEKALTHAEQLFAEGTHYIDVGGESTRPEAHELSWQEEWGRVSEVLKGLLQKYSGKISLDTKNWQTAEQFLKLGGTVLNDVSGFQDPKMIEVAVRHQPLVIMNHFPGENTMQVHQQQIDSLEQIQDELLGRKEALINAGICSENIILDPGIGFGKTMELNWKLLEFAKYVPKEKVMIGYSRKRFLGEQRFETALNIDAGKRAIEAGACFLRVHEVFLLNPA